MQYVASISYGKDSLAMLYVIKEVLKKPLDRIITAEVWATDTIQADLPPMVEFKDHADRIIKERWGIEVERFCALKHDGTRQSYDDVFHTRKQKGNYKGQIYGFPYMLGAWCNSRLKMEAVNNANKATRGAVSYIGIAADEQKRIERHGKKKNVEMPLVDAGWTEPMCREWCEQNDLLSPLYATSNRGGCWFCHNQGVDQLRLLRKQYPELWKILLAWDDESPRTFQADGKMVHDWEKRFALEDDGYIFEGEKFKWDMTKAAQMNINQFL